VGRRISVPIAFRNGRVNYVKPESLAPGRRKTLDDRLTKLGFNGQLIYRHPVDNEEGKLVVLSSDPRAESDTEEHFRKTLEDFHVRFVAYRDAQAFASEVEQTAH
jgi:hypothetical protein